MATAIIQEVKSQIERVERQIEVIGREVEVLEQEIVVVGRKIEGTEQQMEAVEKQFETAEPGDASYRRLEKKEDSLRQRVAALTQRVAALTQRVATLTQRMATLTQEKMVLTQALTQEWAVLRERETLQLKRESQLELSGAEVTSRQWIESMCAGKPELPRNKADVARVLFPDVHGKLPVTNRTYQSYKVVGVEAEEFLVVADDSLVPVIVSAALLSSRPVPLSEMNTTSYISHQLISFFEMLKTYSPHTLVHTLAFNCTEKTAYSFSEVTPDRSRPDTLCVASGRTLLVGEDKLQNLHAAEQDLRTKVKMLPPIYYGELEFILGYVAAGSQFQWIYVGRNGGNDISPIYPLLDLSLYQHKCLFCLSLCYAYHLMCSMVDAIPVVPSNRAMFSKDEKGNRTIVFYPDYVLKTIKEFASYCELVATKVDAVTRAYEVSTGCLSLPQCMSAKLTRSGTYIIKYSPVGYPPTLRSEQAVTNMARCVCEALLVLHSNGLVHRDIRLANIVQISKDRFLLIDLETAAVCPNRVPPGFRGLVDWSSDTLEGGSYTTMSDMYQLGKLLASMGEVVSSPNAVAFVKQLLSKRLSAQLALKDPWLSNPMPCRHATGLSMVWN